MTDHLEHRMRGWAHDLDDSIASRTHEQPYVQPVPTPQRSRTGLVAAAAVCLLIGSLAISAATTSNRPDDGAPVGADGGPEQTQSDPYTPSGGDAPEGLDPIRTEALLAQPTGAYVSTDAGDRIGLVVRQNGELCVDLQLAGDPSVGSVCTHRNDASTLVGASRAHDSDEVAIFGALGGNATSLRGEGPDGEIVSLDTLRVPDAGGSRVFVLKAQIDSPLASLSVISHSGDVLASLDAGEYFRHFR